MANLRVLIADDDPNVCEIIRLYFEQNQIDSIEAGNGEEAVRLAEEEEPDVIILDIMMPGMDGYEVCRHVRQKTDVPIIMLTAKDEEFDRVLGLELGADDYVTKPFSPREIMARIKAILRRVPAHDQNQSEESPPKEKSQVLKAGHLTLRLDKREVAVGKHILSFRPKEFDLLAYMMQNPGVVFSREQLLEKVWGYDYFGDIRTVDVHIKKLRQKLQNHKVENIQTVWGVGYRFQLIDEDEGGSA